MRHPRQVLTRDIIYERVWGYDFGGESNIVEVYVRYLRAKLEADGAPRLLQTVRGVGYALGGARMNIASCALCIDAGCAQDHPRRALPASSLICGHE